MKKIVAIAAVALVLPLVVKAEEPVKKKEVKVKKEEKKETSDRGGNVFTHFWVHTVGGTIGNGLKTGAHKIEKTFD